MKKASDFYKTTIIYFYPKTYRFFSLGVMAKIKHQFNVSKIRFLKSETIIDNLSP